MAKSSLKQNLNDIAHAGIAVTTDNLKSLALQGLVNKSALAGITSGPRSGDDDGGGDSSWSGPWSGYGYGGGGYGGKSPAEVQEETQQQIYNLGDIYGDRARDLDQISQDSLGNIKNRINDNENVYKYGLQMAQQNIDWQPPQQRLQSVNAALRDRMGNAAYGSGMADLTEGMSRAEDMSNYEQIKTYKDNMRGLWTDYFNALSTLQSDYADQVNSIRDEFSKQNAQYASAISNISPKLGTKENLQKAANGETVTVGEGTDAYTLPKANLNPSDALQALLVTLEMPDVFNPAVSNYVRPDRAVNAANLIPHTGNVNKASAAHRAFSDELDAYKRRV